MDLDINSIISDNIFSEEKSLDLSGFKLSSIPDEVFGLIHLTELKLINNNIDVVPDDICNLSNLTHLYLYQNNIVDIPFDALTKMKFLECIDLGENPIVINNSKKISDVYEALENKWHHYRILVKEIKKNDDKKMIYFDGYLPEIPPEIFTLKRLKYLSLSNSGLKRLPSEIYQLENLESLDITDAEINHLPRDILSLKKLRRVNFDANKFTDFPEVLLDHPSISDISINNNFITHIKPILDDVVKNEKITSFSCANNPLEDFDEEMFRGGLSFIKKFHYSDEEE